MMKIGILGGGQLARMIIEESSRYGFEFFILSKEADSPAGKLTRHETIGNWNDPDIVREFSSQCDIITLENEFIDYHVIECIERSGRIILPGSETVRLIQDKFFQKKTLSEIGIPVADFTEVSTSDDVKKFASEFGYPVILKTRTMGYDGKGNLKIEGESDVEDACTHLSKRGKLMCERFVEFDKEIATQAVRSANGELKVYPAVETVQEDHICKYVIASQDRFASLKDEVEDISTKLLTYMNYSGVMGIEMFLSGNGILVNELAPRVHNSGHYTIEGCETSQFENHIRAIAGLPLGSTELKTFAAVMVNILGDRNGHALTGGIEKVLSRKNTYLHLYGKNDTRIGRKMGHITLTGEDADELLKNSIEVRSNLMI
jgi:phosphoribosylaminoimidazole carboxylase PurK protein